MKAEGTALRPTTPAANASRGAYSKVFFPRVSYNHKTFPRKRLFDSWRAIVDGMREFKDVVLSTSATSRLWLPHALQQRASSSLQRGATITSIGSRDGLQAAHALKRYAS